MWFPKRHLTTIIEMDNNSCKKSQDFRQRVIIIKGLRCIDIKTVNKKTNNIISAYIEKKGL